MNDNADISDPGKDMRVTVLGPAGWRMNADTTAEKLLKDIRFNRGSGQSTQPAPR